jgi:hypothetical protein
MSTSGREPPLPVAATAGPHVATVEPTLPAMADSPTVHVTIGRIEIRAAAPTPDAIRQPQAKPTGIMTLEEYVERRSHKGV